MDARPTRRIARLAVAAVVTAGLAGPMVATPAAAASGDERALRAMVNDARDQVTVLFFG